MGVGIDYTNHVNSPCCVFPALMQNFFGFKFV